MFGDVRRCSARFGEVRRGSARFGEVRRCSARFGEVRRCYPMLSDVQRCSAMFDDVRRYYPMFSDIIRCSAILSELQFTIVTHPLVPISSYVPTPTAIRSPLLLPPRPASQPVSTDPAVDPVTRSATQPPQTARRMTQTFASQPISFEPQTSNHISHNINQLPQLSVPPLGFNLQIATTTKTSAGTGGSEFAYSDAKLG